MEQHQEQQYTTRILENHFNKRIPAPVAEGERLDPPSAERCQTTESVRWGFRGRRCRTVMTAEPPETQLVACLVV